MIFTGRGLQTLRQVVTLIGCRWLTIVSTSLQENLVLTPRIRGISCIVICYQLLRVTHRVGIDQLRKIGWMFKLKSLSKIRIWELVHRYVGVDFVVRPLDDRARVQAILQIIQDVVI